MQVTSLDTSSLVMILVSVIAPLVVALVTKASWSPATRSVVLLAISACVGFANGFLAAPPGMTWDWKVALVNTLISFVIAVATYFGLWKSTPLPAALLDRGIKDGVHVITDKAPNP